MYYLDFDRLSHRPSRLGQDEFTDITPAEDFSIGHAVLVGKHDAAATITKYVIVGGVVLAVIAILPDTIIRKVKRIFS